MEPLLMSAIALVGSQYAHHVKIELLLSYLILPILGVMMETEYQWLGLGTFCCLLTINAFVYHVFLGRLTSGSVRVATVFAAGAFIIEQYLGLFVGLHNLLFFLMHL